jgi:hypothetical protein
MPKRPLESEAYSLFDLFNMDAYSGENNSMKRVVFSGASNFSLQSIANSRRL